MKNQTSAGRIEISLFQSPAGLLLKKTFFYA